MEDQAVLYDKLYGAGYHSDLNETHAQELCNWLETNISFDSILDIGCSHGWVMRRFPDKRAVGIDISSIAVRRCEALGLVAYQGWAHKLPFADNSFDVVMSTDCFEHIEPEKVLKAIQEACRVAKKAVAMKICTRADRAHWRDVVKQPLHLTIERIGWWEYLFHETFEQSKVGQKIVMKRFFDNETFILEVVE